MLKTVFSFCFIAIFLAGCSSKKNNLLLNDFKKNQTKFEQIQKTDKVIISDKGKVIGFITGLYEPEVKYEKFLVGIYPQEELQKLHFRLNGVDVLKIEKVANDDFRLGQMPLKNKWSRYFKLIFVKSDENKLTLQIKNGNLWQKEMIFSKIPNYLNVKEVF